MSGSIHRRAAALLIGLPLLAGCGLDLNTPGPLPLFQQDGAGSTLFSVGYSRISTVYLEQVDLSELTVTGLSGLATIDQRIRADRVDDQVRVLANRTAVAAFAAPEDRDAAGWGRVVVDGIAAARAVSPALSTATDDDVHAAVFNAITANLDPYSRYVSPDQAQQERAYREGYGGIGLLLEKDETDRPWIREVFSDGPAARAGVLAGDVILAVDGKPALGLALDQLGEALRGPIGSEVRLTLEAPSGQTRILALVRERVVPNPVTIRTEDGIVILRVSRFNAGTAAKVSEAVTAELDALGGGARGLILDLRGNPGGLLGQSVDVADLFITRGEIISTRGRHPDSVQHYYSQSDDIADGLPMALLIDGRSASASEIVAAALQDSGRAVLVGASTFGKGSVQTVTRLPNDGELFLTWSRIFAPSGYTLHLQGVLPTLCTSNGAADSDELIDQYQSGALQVPTRLSTWRLAAPESQAALDILRAACPWQDHDEVLDIMVAKRLLLDPNLYGPALAEGSRTVAQR